MIVAQKMFGYCGRPRAVSLFVIRSAMFVEVVFKVAEHSFQEPMPNSP